MYKKHSCFVALALFLSVSADAGVTLKGRVVRELIDSVRERFQAEKVYPEALTFPLGELMTRYELTNAEASGLVEIARHANYRPVPGSYDPLFNEISRNANRQTANQQGVEWTTATIPHIRAFREALAEKPEAVVLDVGATYGYNTHLALQAGARSVLAIDPEPRHLAVLVRDTPYEFLDRLEIVLGTFPEDLQLAANSYDIALFGMVFQFMSFEQMRNTLIQTYAGLKPSGRLIASTRTIYGTEFIGHREPLEARNHLGRQAIGRVKNFIFPTYCAELFPKTPHPMDLRVTQFNLSLVGFQVDEAFEFTTGFNAQTREVVIVKKEQLGPAPALLFFISAHKPDGVTDAPVIEFRSGYPCGHCGTLAHHKCGGCESVRYCSVECQKGNWKAHRKNCRK
jgi:SAM-dependent methyltransferase